MTIFARRLNRKHGQGDVEFWTEVSVLSGLQHTNIISFIGFCDEKGEKIIITTYQPKGSLEMHLNSPNLTWTQRLRICVGVARALSYLCKEEGRSYGVIHRNINSSTILLDENREAKLSGFEVSIKQLYQENMNSTIYEAIYIEGYMDPAVVKTRIVTHKSDVYSFGVVLYEILCGRKAFIPKAVNEFLAPLATFHYEKGTLQDIVRPDLRNQTSQESFLYFSKVAYDCLKEERLQRPDIHQVLIKLEQALECELKLDQLKKNLEHLKISLSDIKLATNNFSDTCHIASDGYYNLYRAEVDHFDIESPYSIEVKNKGELPKKRRNTVVIKRIVPGKDEKGETFFTEIEMLTSCKHRNIVTLLGFCVEGPDEMILVIENASNGYLGFYLNSINKMPILSWTRRLKICVDVAHGLHYLHSEMENQKKIIHRDVKSENIALDENWRAKISDFGISVYLPPDQDDEALYFDVIAGTRAYCDPEYVKTGKLKRESDVYSFGVVLFEIFCGRMAYDPIYMKDEDEDEGLAAVARRCFHNGTLKEMIDPLILEENGEYSFNLNRGPNKDSLDILLRIAYACVAETQDQRPTMEAVVKELEKALSFQENDGNLRISFRDIKLATGNFHHDNRVGGGGFGNVYKGTLPQDDGFKTIVAKRLDTRHGQGEQHFRNELQILFQYKHENVVSLVGYCDEKDDKVILYEYEVRGSLDRYLSDAHLTWMKRLTICIDVATALDFLHGGAGRQAVVIHRDIKTPNILLNHDWKAKVADFGLSLISPINQEIDYVIDHACGTKGYLDPLYQRSGFLTIESDIYSFGVVLFEILCGRSTFAIYKHKGQFLPGFIKHSFEEGKHDEVVFEAIKEQIKQKSLDTFQRIAFQCLDDDREKRPTAKEVLAQLKMAFEFQDDQ